MNGSVLEMRKVWTIYTKQLSIPAQLSIFQRYNFYGHFINNRVKFQVLLINQIKKT